MNNNNLQHHNNNYSSNPNNLTDQTSSTIPAEAYNAIKNIFEQPQFETFVSTYMSNVFLPEEQPPVEAQEFSMEELSFEQVEPSTGTYGTLEFLPCHSCDVKFKVKFEEFHPSSYPPYEEQFNYEQSSIFPMTASFNNKLSFQQKGHPSSPLFTRKFHWRQATVDVPTHQALHRHLPSPTHLCFLLLERRLLHLVVL